MSRTVFWQAKRAAYVLLFSAKVATADVGHGWSWALQQRGALVLAIFVAVRVLRDVRLPKDRFCVVTQAILKTPNNLLIWRFKDREHWIASNISYRTPFQRYGYKALGNQQNSCDTF